jgi:hypothetical protein
VTGKVVEVKAEADGDIHFELADATGRKRGRATREGIRRVSSGAIIAINHRHSEVSKLNLFLICGLTGRVSRRRSVLTCSQVKRIEIRRP